MQISPFYISMTIAIVGAVLMVQAAAFARGVGYWIAGLFLVLLGIVLLLRKPAIVAVEPQPTASKYISGWGCLLLIVLYVVIELTAISTIGSNANGTFQLVAPKNTSPESHTAPESTKKHLDP